MRAQGAKRTVLTRTREGASPRAMTSNHTSPVKQLGRALGGRLLREQFHVVSLRSGLDEDLEGLAGVHGAVAVGDVVEADGAVEHLARARCVPSRTSGSSSSM